MGERVESRICQGKAEQIIVARAISGDREAFRDLYTNNVSAVVGFLRNRVGWQEAEDMAAETFCRAFEHLGSYQDRGVPFRAWLLRIAFNLIVADSRKSRNSIPTAYLPYSGEVPGPESKAVARSEIERLRHSMALLSVEHQTVLSLRYLGELSVANTAIVLDIKEDAVRSLTYRALKALRQRYGSSK